MRRAWRPAPSQLADGAAVRGVGADQLASGAGDLATGLDDLTTGATDAQAGATELADGLGQGVGAVPSYTDDQRDQLVRTVADPVDLQPVTTGSVAATGAVLPLVAVLVLWLGALATFLVRRALPVGAERTAASALRLTLRSWGPAALVGLGQVLTLAAVVAAFGVDVVSPVGAVAVGLLVALAFVGAAPGARPPSADGSARCCRWCCSSSRWRRWAGSSRSPPPPGRSSCSAASCRCRWPSTRSPRWCRAARPRSPVRSPALVAWTLVPLAVTTWAARRRQQWSVSSIREQLEGPGRLQPA